MSSFQAKCCHFHVGPCLKQKLKSVGHPATRQPTRTSQKCQQLVSSSPSLWASEPSNWKYFNPAHWTRLEHCSLIRHLVRCQIHPDWPAHTSDGFILLDSNPAGFSFSHFLCFFDESSLFWLGITQIWSSSSYIHTIFTIHSKLYFAEKYFII